MASRAAWINAGPATPIGSAVITAAGDTLTVDSHGRAEGDLVAFDTLTGGADGPLEEQVFYYVRNVSGDDFQVSGSRGGNPIEFAADGTAEAYTAVPSYSGEELRQIGSHTLFHGHADRLGARSGVRPGAGDPVTVAGGAYTIQAHTGVVVAGEYPTQGPYTYAQLQDGPFTLDPADGSNQRIDALDVQISDDDADGSGGRGHDILYVTGTPAGSATPPPLSDRSARLATITVPAGNTSGATVATLAPWAVASGGVLPARTQAELPSAGYAGMAAWQEDTQALRVHDGDTTWLTAASGHGFQTGQILYFTTPGTASFVRATYPGLRAIRVKCQGGGGGGGGTQATDSSEGSSSGGGSGGVYAESWLLAADITSSVTVTVGAGGAAGAAASNGGGGGASSFGAFTAAPGGNGGNTRAPSDGHRASTGASSPTTGTGDLVIPGGGGGAGYSMGTAVISGGTADKGIGGAGGSAVLSGGATRTTRGPEVGPTAGVRYGGGGSGHVNSVSEAGKLGGVGAQGIVIVELYY